MANHRSFPRKALRTVGCITAAVSLHLAAFTPTAMADGIDQSSPQDDVQTMDVVLCPPYIEWLCDLFHVG